MEGFWKELRIDLTSRIGWLLRGYNDIEADDLFQDAVVSLYNRADVAAPLENLSAYIYRSMRNRIIDLLRARKDTLSLDKSDTEGLTLRDALRDDSAEPEAILERERLRTAISNALSELKPDERDLVVASELENRSLAEISRELNVPHGTLLSRKSRAMKKLQSLLVKEWEDN